MHRRKIYKRPRGYGKKFPIGTKLYPFQLEYIDAAAERLCSSRYEVIYKALQLIFGFPDAK